MPRQHVLVTAQQAGKARTANLYGREHLVFPAVLVREQVLENNLGATFLPAEEIAASASDWNGVDVVIRHPTKNGRPIGARAPEILNAIGVGRLWSARFEDDALKSEVWIDAERIDGVDDASEIVDAVNAGAATELSTGFDAVVEEISGTFDGESYAVVLRDIRPDHLALLVEEVGACSTEDGCGLGVNARKDCECESCRARNATGDADGVAEGIATRVWAHLRSLIGNQEISHDDIREMIRAAAEREWGGDGVYVYVPEVFDEDAVVAIDPQDDAETLFRVAYTIDEESREATLDVENAVEVMRVTEFVPVGNEMTVQHHYPERPAAKPAKNADCGCGCGGACNTTARVIHAIDFAPSSDGGITTQTRYRITNAREEKGMTTEELINALVDCDEVEEDRAALEAMEPDALAELATEAGIATEEKEEPEPKPDPKPKADPDPKPAAENAAPEWAKALVEKVDDVANRLEKLEEETEPSRNAAAEERKRLIDAIAANTEFTEAELEPKPVSELRKLHKATNEKPKNYAGLGGPTRESPTNKKLGFTPRSTLGAGPGAPMNDDDGKES